MSENSSENINKILMTQTLEDKQKAVSYLLGELSGAERDAFEDRLFLDEDFSSFLSDVENDLIDEYVRGELAPSERLKFENAYLTSDSRRQRVRAAQILQTELFNETQGKEIVVSGEKVSFWESLTAFVRLPNLAMAGGLAIILLFLLGAIWFLSVEDIDKERVTVENTNETFPPPPQKTPEDLPENNQNANNSLENDSELNNAPGEINKPKIELKMPEINKPTIELKKPEIKKTPDPKEVPRSPRIFAFTLLPPTRSSERPVLKIPLTAKQVRLQILNNFEKNFIKYTVEITNENGEAIFKRDFASDGNRAKKSFSLNLPNESLPAGGYEITLLGTGADGNVEEINFYNFTVNKK